MANKLDAKKVIEAMKKVALEPKPKAPFNPVVKLSHRERDMRQEAMDMGAHGAKEYFGGSNDAGAV